MAEARIRQDWQTASSIIWSVFRSQGGKGARRLKPSDFDPFEAKKNAGVPVTAANIAVLKALAGKAKTKGA
jgi:hypothetical protein